MDYIKRAVAQLINEHETRDPFRLARALGIDVDEFPFRKIKGMIIEIGEKTLIVLNSLMPEELKGLVLAHELGHRILSPRGAGYFFLTEYTLMETKVEYQANRFMVELLTGDKDPEAGETLEQFAARLGMPAEMMRYRIIK